jgi:Mrp family chromosome partitioning ATPase
MDGGSVAACVRPGGYDRRTVSRPRRSVPAKVLLALVVAVVAGGVAYLITAYGIGRADVVARFAVSGDVGAPSADLPVYRAAARQDDVLRDVLGRIGREASPEALAELRERIAVDVTTDAAGRTVLQVRSSAPSVAAASELGDALAGALAAWDRSAAAQRLRQASTALDRRIDALTDEIRALQVLGSGDAAASIEERAALIAERDRVLASAATGDVGSLEVLDVSVLRAGPPPLWNAGLAGAIAGLAMLLFQLPLTSGPAARPPRSAAPGAGALGAFPRASGRDDPALAGAAIGLASAILGRTIDERPLVFVVTGTDAGVGATTVACLLAEELARRGRRTLLVDAHLAAPGVGARYRDRAAFTDDPGAGSTVAWLRDPERAPAFASVDLAGGGRLDLVLQSRPTRLAPGSKEAFFAGLPAAIAHWSGYQTVVIDSGPILAFEDTRWLVPVATGTLLVERSEGWDERRIRAAHEQVREAGGSLLGLVENDAPVDALRGPSSEGEARTEERLRVVRHDGSSTERFRGEEGRASRRTS